MAIVLAKCDKGHYIIMCILYIYIVSLLDLQASHLLFLSGTASTVKNSATFYTPHQ